MKSVEDAYLSIAESLTTSATGPWSYLRVIAPILNSNLGGTSTFQTTVDGKDNDLSLGWKLFEVQDAALFLRDDIFKTTGQRIWGLTFTLYPDGNFNIEYDYNKPEGYEETDETISGDEINESLARLAGRADASK